MQTHNQEAAGLGEVQWVQVVPKPQGVHQTAPGRRLGKGQTILEGTCGCGVLASDVAEGGSGNAGCSTGIDIKQLLPVLEMN